MHHCLCSHIRELIQTNLKNNISGSILILFQKHIWRLFTWLLREVAWKWLVFCCKMAQKQMFKLILDLLLSWLLLKIITAKLLGFFSGDSLRVSGDSQKIFVHLIWDKVDEWVLRYGANAEIVCKRRQTALDKAQNVEMQVKILSKIGIRKRTVTRCHFIPNSLTIELLKRLQGQAWSFEDSRSKGRTPIGHVHLNQFIDFLHQQTELIHNETNRFQLLENYNIQLEAELETEKSENEGFATKLQV